MPVSCQFYWPSKLSLFSFFWTTVQCKSDVRCICHLNFVLPHWLQGGIHGRGLAPPPYFWTKLKKNFWETESPPPPPRPPEPPPPQLSAVRNPQSALVPLRWPWLLQLFHSYNFLEIKLLGVVTDIKRFNLVKYRK